MDSDPAPREWRRKDDNGSSERTVGEDETEDRASKGGRKNDGTPLSMNVWGSKKARYIAVAQRRGSM